jgi:hypothetical protein
MLELNSRAFAAKNIFKGFFEMLDPEKETPIPGQGIGAKNQTSTSINIAKTTENATGLIDVESDPPDMREYAVALATRGLPVFKLTRELKPAAGKWWLGAARTPGAARAMWSYPDGSARPDNIGIATGALADGEGGIVAVDMDVKPDENGMATRAGKASLQELVDRRLPLETFTQSTKNEGQHLLFRTPPGDECSSLTNYLPGLDIKGYHGFVVGAGSELNGKFYKIIKNVPLVDLPPQFVGEWRRADCAKVAVQDGALPEYADDEWAIRRATKWLVEDAPIGR